MYTEREDRKRIFLTRSGKRPTLKRDCKVLKISKEVIVAKDMSEDKLVSQVGRLFANLWPWGWTKVS